MDESNKVNIQQRKTGFFRTFFRVLLAELRLELRSPAGFLSVLLFSLILGTLYQYAMSDNIFEEIMNLQGIGLATVFFSATLISARSSQHERESLALRPVLMSAGDPAGYFLARVFGQWTVLVLALVIFFPVYYILLGNRAVDSSLLPGSILVAAIASFSLAALGAMLGMMAGANRMRDLILPVLLLPAAMPVFLLATDAFEEIVETAAIFPPLQSILALLTPGFLYGALGALLFQFYAGDE